MVQELSRVNRIHIHHVSSWCRTADKSLVDTVTITLIDCRYMNTIARVSRRAEEIAPFYVMEILEKAKELEARGEHIIHLEVGEPDFPTPELVKNKAVEALQKNRTFYTHSLGTIELRERISHYYHEEEGIDVSPDRIIITNGTSGAFLLLFAALLGDKGLAISDPGYPCYRNFGMLFGAKIHTIPVSADTRYEITPDILKKYCYGRVIPDVFVLSNPSNPTGIIYSEKNLYAIADYTFSRGSLLIADEIYSGITYEHAITPALSVSDNIIVVNGFSKNFAMTGWRLGWMVVPPWLVRPVQKIAQNVFISPPTVSQYAAIFAFESKKETDIMRETYQRRRDFLVPRLQEIGFDIPVYPEGAFYVYANIERWGIDSMVFSHRALTEAGVAITPGYDFGTHNAGSHVRFTYANNLDALKVGCDRLETWLKTL